MPPTANAALPAHHADAGAQTNGFASCGAGPTRDYRPGPANFTCQELCADFILFPDVDVNMWCKHTTISKFTRFIFTMVIYLSIQLRIRSVPFTVGRQGNQQPIISTVHYNIAFFRNSAQARSKNLFGFQWMSEVKETGTNTPSATSTQHLPLRLLSFKPQI